MQEWLFERLANMASNRLYASSITGARSSINEFAGTEALLAISFAGSLDTRQLRSKETMGKDAVLVKKIAPALH